MNAECEGAAKSGTAVEPRLTVGIGASAGGLEACKRFLAEMPADNGMAFVVVMHLDPTHESHVAEIFRTWTAMAVTQVSSEQRIEPNHVYVIAPDSFLEVRQGLVIPKKQEDQPARRRPIDALFSSLAQDQQHRAVAVVLSGAGSDGSAGLQDVKAAGGLCLAQDPVTAEYADMPKSAIDTEVVDLVLPPEHMPRALLAYADQPHVAAPVQAEAQEGGPPPAAFGAILDLLGKKYGLDFRSYKKATLRRRCERRMALAQISGWQAYLEHLHETPEEPAALYRDLLIGVTQFFRDRAVWEHLETDVIPRMIAARNDDAPLRVWVPGTATGEEAYSFAILLLEQLARAGRSAKPQIYATDVNPGAVAFGRRGLYPSTIAGDVAPERLAQFFGLQENGDFQVKQAVRDTVTFAVHNLLADPPFCKLDVVSCRNVLIYLEPSAQDYVFELFHFSLRPGGLLVLGSSETTGRKTRLFEPLSKTHRTFTSAAVARTGWAPPEWFVGRAAPRDLHPPWTEPSRGGGLPAWSSSSSWVATPLPVLRSTRASRSCTFLGRRMTTWCPLRGKCTWTSCLGRGPASTPVSVLASGTLPNARRA